MEYLKLFEEYQKNNQTLLYDLTKGARDILDKKEKLNGCFTDYCDLGAEVLSEILKNKGIPHKIVYGDRYHQFENSELDHYGHTWVEVLNNGEIIILDPTIEQFDSTKYLLTDKDDEFYNYDKTKVVYESYI